MEKIPSIDMNSIQEAVYDYTEGNLKNYACSVNCDEIPKEELTVERYLKEFTKYDRPITHEEIVKYLTPILEAGTLSPMGKEICEHLITNPRYAPKMVQCFDGSYRNNRIWFNNNGDMEIWARYSQRPFCYEKFENKSAKYILNWLWNHYDTIYFMVPHFESVEEVLHEIEWRKRLDQFDF